MTIYATIMIHLYRKLLEDLLARGQVAIARGRPTRELLGMTLRLGDSAQNVLVHPVRNLNYRFMVAEWLWVALGRNRLADLTRYNSKMAAFSDDGLTLAGAYGPRLRPQLPYLFRALADPDSRQAVATIWTPSPPASRDLPCTLALQFLLRDRRLNLIVTMRSSDAWLGIPYDFFTMSMLQNSIAGTLGVARGFIQFNLGSSHLYEEDASKAQELLYCSPLADEQLASPALDGLPQETMASIFDETIACYGLTKEWLLYRRCLLANTSKECLEVLREANRP
ncbi:hypothetical protein LCGC14_1836410 [marine sediment metagenome]|uniref:thymidylate synthase n=1 Tax=marine sediment metagenome TaxID=412755 RepID=A0A0F9H2Q4_9ZZZZ